MTTQEAPEIRVIKPGEIFQYWEQLKNSDILKFHKEEDLALQCGKVACGEWIGLGFFQDNKLRGLVIFEPRQLTVDGKTIWYATTKQIYAPYNGRTFLPMFLALLKEWGYSRVGGGTGRDGQAMARLFGFRIVYTYIEKEL